MSSLDEYYSRKFTEKEKQAAKDRALADQIEQEKKNKLKELMCRQIIPAMLSAAEVSHPECEKLLWPNHKEIGFFCKKRVDEFFFGWLIYHSGNHDVYLLTDGRLINFKIPRSMCDNEWIENAISGEVDLNSTQTGVDGIGKLFGNLINKARYFGVSKSNLRRWQKALEEI